MSFTWPAMLLSLLALPLILLLYGRVQRRRQRLMASYAGLGLEAQGGMRRHVPLAILMVGLTLLMIALARPQAVVHLPQAEGTVILAFDVSGSMAAGDMEPPEQNGREGTRLEAAKAAAVGFLEHQPDGILVGVVAFSDNGFTVQAPTDDQEAVLGTVSRLAPERGTSLANGVFAALNLIATVNGEPAPRVYTEQAPGPPSVATPGPLSGGRTANAIIVLLSDGENNEEPDPLEAAQAASDLGVRIHTVGIGSAEGTRLEVNGFVVHTQLQEAMLQQVAERAGGQYYNAGSEEDLRSVFDDIDRQLAIKPQEMEVTSLFAGSSILALLIGAALSLLWFSRVP